MVVTSCERIKEIRLSVIPRVKKLAQSKRNLYPGIVALTGTQDDTHDGVLSGIFEKEQRVDRRPTKTSRKNALCLLVGNRSDGPFRKLHDWAESCVHVSCLFGC